MVGRFLKGFSSFRIEVRLPGLRQFRYEPNALPLSNLDYRLLLPLVGQANIALARYDGLLQGIPTKAGSCLRG